MHCGLEFARSEGVISFIENSKKQYKTCVILRFWLSVIDPSPQPSPDADDEISREAPGECLGDAASGGARAHHLRGARHGEGGSS